jgi:hypothetical protein
MKVQVARKQRGREKNREIFCRQCIVTKRNEVAAATVRDAVHDR